MLRGKQHVLIVKYLQTYKYFYSNMLSLTLFNKKKKPNHLGSTSNNNSGIMQGAIRCLKKY